MKKIKHLFEPIRIGGMEVKNRIVMSPMGSNLCSTDGTTSSILIDHYTARAKGGVGLIITEDTSIGPKYIANTLLLNDDRFIPGWQELTDSVHAHGAKIAPQLMHPSFNARSSVTGVQPVAASPIPSRIHREVPRELTIDEIEEIITNFGLAAVRAQKGGCDAAFLHCAHCYHLLGSFLSPLYNKRVDEYGGDIEGRLRLPLRVIEEIRAKTGPDFPIIIRISGAEYEPGGRTLAETAALAPRLVEAGVSAIQISAGTLQYGWITTPPCGTPVAAYAFMTEAIKKVVDVPVICGGRMTTVQVAEQTLANEQADMIAMARGVLVDPELPNKAAEGRFEDITPCIGDLHCLTSVVTDHKICCLVNATVGRDREMALVPTDDPKNVLVIGGGPAGMEAARVAALRGHKVTLVEKDARLGGQLILAAFPPMKQEITRLVKYLAAQIKKAGVTVELNREATVEEIEARKPDVVIVATGALPCAPPIPGIDNPNAATAWDVLRGRLVAGPKIVVAGGGKVGCETADFLAHPVDDNHPRGNRVTIIEMLPHVALEERSSARTLLMQRLKSKGVEIITCAQISRILNDGVEYVRDGKQEAVRGVDTVVLAMGARPHDPLSEKLKEKNINTLVIGDAQKACSAVEAIGQGYETARNL